MLKIILGKGDTLKISRRPYDTKFPKPNKIKENLEAYLDLLVN
jgi:hypothetical protein